MDNASRDSQANESFIRPDPIRGQIGDAGYAARYIQSHRNITDAIAYRSGYADLLALDALMPKDYSLLDVGCGTAGYHRLLLRQGRITGIDPSPDMIVAANRFKEENRIADAVYECSTFEEFVPNRGLDAIRLTGVYGWYMPWRGRMAVLEKAFRLLNPLGIVLLSYVPPDRPLHVVKALLAPAWTVVIFRRRFVAMVCAAGFTPILEVRMSKATVLFARKPDSAAPPTESGVKISL